MDTVVDVARIAVVVVRIVVAAEGAVVAVVGSDTAADRLVLAVDHLPDKHRAPHWDNNLAAY